MTREEYAMIRARRTLRPVFLYNMTGGGVWQNAQRTEDRAWERGWYEGIAEWDTADEAGRERLAYAIETEELGHQAGMRSLIQFDSGPFVGREQRKATYEAVAAEVRAARQDGAIPVRPVRAGDRARLVSSPDPLDQHRVGQVVTLLDFDEDAPEGYAWAVRLADGRPDGAHRDCVWERV